MLLFFFSFSLSRSRLFSPFRDSAPRRGQRDARGKSGNYIPKRDSVLLDFSSPDIPGIVLQPCDVRFERTGEILHRYARLDLCGVKRSERERKRGSANECLCCSVAIRIVYSHKITRYRVCAALSAIAITARVITPLRGNRREVCIAFYFLFSILTLGKYSGLISLSAL